ncbi:MAG: multicopper oxidase domain-containing protein [Candidatus Paceibacterota bacterium]
MDNLENSLEQKERSGQGRYYWLFGLIIILIAGAFIFTGDKEPALAPTNNEVDSDLASEEEMPTAKEFAFDSFVEMVDGEARPQFSRDAITVNQGDLVRLKVTVTSGRHSFYLDEFGIAVDTPTGEETVIEFVADQSGKFIYYCNMPGHREAGHFGTLIVLEA